MQRTVSVCCEERYNSFPHADENDAFADATHYGYNSRKLEEFYSTSFKQQM